MKLIGLFITIFIMSLTTYGQESEEYKRLKKKRNHKEGYIVKRDSTLVEGLIKLYPLSSAHNFDHITFIHKNGEKEAFYPSELKSYGYDDLEFVADMSSFYIEAIKGERLSLYHSILSYPQQGTTATSSSGLYFCKTGESKFIWLSFKKFDFTFGEYFKDCPELSQKIIDKELTRDDAREIMALYDNCD